MKQGCLLLLAVLGAAFYGYRELLIGTEYESMWWIPLLLGVGAAMVVGNFQGIILALRHFRASARSQVQWKDGDLVVVSGRLQPTKNSIVAPVSGKPATIVEYEIVRYSRTSDSTTTVVDYRGCLMAPCSIQSNTGQVSVVGFPLLTQWGAETLSDIESYKRVAKFLLTAPTTIMQKSPVAAIAQLNQILKDDDGDVNANFRQASAKDIQEFAGGANAIASSQTDPEDHSEEEVDPPDPEDSEIEDEEQGMPESSDPVETASYYLRSNGYNLKETIVPSGAEVTIMGTYKAQNRQVNIGSGLSKLSHGLYLGPASKVLGKNLKKSVITTLVFAAIFAAGNYFLLKQLGIEPADLIQKSQILISNLQDKLK